MGVLVADKRKIPVQEGVTQRVAAFPIHRLFELAPELP
jgi:hypothetical protein